MCLKKFIKLSIGAKQIDVWYFIFNATSFKKTQKWANLTALSFHSHCYDLNGVSPSSPSFTVSKATHRCRKQHLHSSYRHLKTLVLPV